MTASVMANVSATTRSGEVGRRTTDARGRKTTKPAVVKANPGHRCPVSDSFARRWGAFF
jgi:hypothetical protein